MERKCLNVDWAKKKVSKLQILSENMNPASTSAILVKQQPHLEQSFAFLIGKERERGIG